MRRHGPWAPCEIIITLYTTIRAIMPYNVPGTMYIARSFTESLSLKVGPPPRPRIDSHIASSRFGRFAKLETRGYSWIMGSRVRPSREKKKRRSPDRRSLARFVGQGGTRGGEKEEEKAAKGRASPPSTGRCHLDCHASSLFHNRRKICATSAGLPRCVDTSTL